MYPVLEDDKSIIQISENTQISVQNFEQRFGLEEKHNFEYDYFINHENITPAWRLIFDDWKTKGILN